MTSSFVMSHQSYLISIFHNKHIANSTKRRKYHNIVNDSLNVAMHD